MILVYSCFPVCIAHTPRVSSEQATLAKKLIEAGADVDAQDNSGNSALHTAARLGSKVCISVLVAANANKRSSNKLKQTPADIAIDAATAELL